MNAGGGRLDAVLLPSGVLGPVVFVASFLVQGTLRPGYDPLRHPVSSLAIGPGGWAQTATFVLSGLLILAFAWGLCRAERGRWTPVLIGLVGCGLVGAGVFTCDPIGGYPPWLPDPAPRTAHGIAHDLFSLPVFTALPAACLVMARRFARAGRRGWASYSAVTAVAFWTFFVLAILGFEQVPAFVATGGLWQRLALVVGLGWLAALALHKLRRRGLHVQNVRNVRLNAPVGPDPRGNGH